MTTNPDLASANSTTQAGPSPDRDHIREIRQAIENWAVWRDAGDWERFVTLWRNDGHMSATWFQGSAVEFAQVSRDGVDNGVSILHFLGGCTVDQKDNRAVAQTKMTISQRGVVHGVLVDVLCTGRFYDFFDFTDDRWLLVRRQPIYEKDRMDPVEPSATLTLDQERLHSLPEGYRHLAYLQQESGFITTHRDLPGLSGASLQRLYDDGDRWLAGSTSPGSLS